MGLKAVSASRLLSELRDARFEAVVFDRVCCFELALSKNVCRILWGSLCSALTEEFAFKIDSRRRARSSLRAARLSTSMVVTEN